MFAKIFPANNPQLISIQHWGCWMNKNLPSGLGRLLAHFQDLLDTGIKTIIKKSDPSSETGKKNKVFTFFSEMGDSYYKTYEKEKRKK